jgi:hypothetical protein
MSCNNCKRKFGKNHISSCKCGDCNLCHFGYTCRNGKTWWLELGNSEKQSEFLPGQSHGGASYPIASCSCSKCFKPRFSQYNTSDNKLKIYSHCGKTCRDHKCIH